MYLILINGQIRKVQTITDEQQAAADVIAESRENGSWQVTKNRHVAAGEILTSEAKADLYLARMRREVRG